MDGLEAEDVQAHMQQLVATQTMMKRIATRCVPDLDDSAPHAFPPTDDCQAISSLATRDGSRMHVKVGVADGSPVSACR